MKDPTQHGYLLLADLTGYTSYLTQVELDHAQEILTDLLEAVVHRVKKGILYAAEDVGNTGNLTENALII